jgi:putative transposase
VIRCDNGPEYVSASVQNWANENEIKIQFIQPGKPQQNAFVERFNRTVRYEWLSQHDWADLEQVRIFATQWIYRYHHERPYMALGGMTPMQRLAMTA